jgi:murein DD-endopeptidase MepM/ murein hydrolase activator NlpD
VSYANQVVVAFEGGTVSRIGFPYSQKSKAKKHFRYVEIATADGCHHRYFYCAPLVDKGDVIERGQTIGSNQTLGLVYPDITQHTHFEVKDGEHKFIDPVPVLEGLGYEIEV